MSGAQPVKSFTAGPWRTELTGRADLNNQQWLVLSDAPGVHEGDSLICEVNETNCICRLKHFTGQECTHCTAKELLAKARGEA